MKIQKHLGTGFIITGTLIACNSEEGKNAVEVDSSDQTHKDSIAIIANFNRQEECCNKGDPEYYVLSELN